MSYILDALKKLETERGQPASIGSTGPAPEPSGRLRYVIVALLAVNVGLVGYWVVDRGMAPQPAARPIAAPAPETVANAPAPAAQMPDAKPRQRKRVMPNGLPGQDRTDFPGLVFSTHVFADEPASRAVFINGTRHAEGDRITPEVVLHRVTDSGVELFYRDYLVEIDVLQEWE